MQNGVSLTRPYVSLSLSYGASNGEHDGSHVRAVRKLKAVNRATVQKSRVSASFSLSLSLSFAFDKSSRKLETIPDIGRVEIQPMALERIYLHAVKKQCTVRF